MISLGNSNKKKDDVDRDNQLFTIFRKRVKNCDQQLYNQLR